jgi:hypothetical protein
LQAIAAHSRAISGATLLGGLVIALWSSMRRHARTDRRAQYHLRREGEATFWHRHTLIFVFTCFGGAFLLMVLA